MYVLGLSCFYHDSAAALLKDGRIVAACQEERLTRKRHDADFPAKAVKYVLREAGIGPEQLDAVGFYDKPLLKFERLLETYLGVVPRGLQSFLMAGPLWLKDKLFMDRQIRAGVGYRDQILYAEHHESHAASAFYPSPFPQAAILTIDGVGEWATASIGIGQDKDITLLHEVHFPHSLGLLYSAFTYYTGFKVNSGEYKVMGLAPYGQPKYARVIKEHLIDIKDDGSFRLNMEYFDYCTGLTMTNERFDRLFGGPRRKPEDRLTQREMDLAASVQLDTRSSVESPAARSRAACTGVSMPSVAHVSSPRSRTATTASQTWPTWRSDGARHAAPRQNLVAPASRARRAAAVPAASRCW